MCVSCASMYIFSNNLFTFCPMSIFHFMLHTLDQPFFPLVLTTAEPTLCVIYNQYTVCLPFRTCTPSEQGFVPVLFTAAFPALEQYNT